MLFRFAFSNSMLLGFKRWHLDQCGWVCVCSQHYIHRRGGWYGTIPYCFDKSSFHVHVSRVLPTCEDTCVVRTPAGDPSGMYYPDVTYYNKAQWKFPLARCFRGGMLACLWPCQLGAVQTCPCTSLTPTLVLTSAAVNSPLQFQLHQKN